MLHREDDKPAVYCAGDKWWFVHGVCKRENGNHNNELADGTRRWTLPDGRLHRADDKPAVEYPNGDCEWWVDGVQHRDGDKPAIISQFTETYYKRGLIHRIENPAVIYKNGRKEWMVGGVLHRDDDKPAVVDSNGDCEWWVNGKRHRNHFPAIIKRNGDKHYYEDGKLLRIEREDETVEWYNYAGLHRDNDLPARVYRDRTAEWWVDGEFVKSG